MPFIPHTPDEVQEMLSVVGVRDLDDLFADIPPEMRPKHFDLPKGQSEFAVCRYFEDLAAANVTPAVSFLGAGFYAHYVPHAVDALSGRSEFYTSYTPYQAECSQGTLQAIFEYQTAVSRLLDMECANASVYDGGTALFEACMMAVRATRRKKLVVDQCINPVWRAMLETYTANLDVALASVDDVEISALMNPPLTCAWVPAYEMGKRAAYMMMEQIAGKDLTGVVETLPVELHIRASSIRSSPAPNP